MRSILSALPEGRFCDINLQGGGGLYFVYNTVYTEGGGGAVCGKYWGGGIFKNSADGDLKNTCRGSRLITVTVC